MVKYSFEALGTLWQVEWEIPGGVNEVLGGKSTATLTTIAAPALDATPAPSPPTPTTSTPTPSGPAQTSSRAHTTAANKKILRLFLERIEDFDQIYSRFRSDSWIMNVAEGGLHTLPADASPLFDFYYRLYQATSGAFTPLIGQLLVEAGYDSSYSLKPSVIHPVLTWEEVITYTPKGLSLAQPTPLDFGAAGKGYLIDILGKLLQEHGVTRFVLDAGRDILHVNPDRNQIKIGLEHPHIVDEVIGVATFTNQSICGSAGNRRKWDHYHHIINPHTKTSPKHILASWVIASSAMVADGLSTALFLTPANELSSVADFEYLLLFEDYRVEKSSGFTADLFFA